MRRLIDDVVATSQPLIECHANEFVVCVNPNIGSMRSDETKLRQAVLNLVSNAAKFTRRGLVTLSARRYQAANCHWIEIEVRDTGIGIAEGDMKALFQDYRQLPAATNRGWEGTGLGLALSQRLCALMGGGISVDSELGHGACFTIRVPADATVPNAEAFSANTGS